MRYRDIAPMGGLAVPAEVREAILADKLFVAEPKYDGSRYILQFVEDGIFLTSRRESVNGGMVEKGPNVPHILDDASFLPLNTVLDGEINVPRGRDFGTVQAIMGSHAERAVELQKTQGKLVYMVFDILYYHGEDLRSKPFSERRKILEKVIEDANCEFIQVVPQYTVDKAKFLRTELANGAEGIMIKKWASTYIEGKKPTGHWYKVKRVETFDGIVTGYEMGKGKYSHTLGALKVSQYVSGVLKEVATISGMTDAQREDFKKRLDAGEEMMVEFEAQEAYGKNNRYRHPRFVRIRTDKNKKECIYG